MNGDDDVLSPLDKAQLLRYRHEQGKSIQNYLNKWGVGDGLRDICDELTAITGDETYQRILGSDSHLDEFRDS